MSTTVTIEYQDAVVATINTGPAGTAGVTDHGALTGLGDDDHAQYALADGTRGQLPWASVTGKPTTFAPSAHAASHGDGGADEITIGQSQVTGLVADLAGKAASSHTHPASEISDSTLAGRTLLTAADAPAQRTALGLGTAATTAATAYATAAQGLLADSAVQPGDLAAVATSGAYGDLTGTPTLVTALDGLSDVKVGTPNDGDLLIYESGTSSFENRKLLASDIPTHTHAATAITSGTLPVARGGTGSASLPATSNYTPTGATLSGHLEGIDSAIGTAAGGGATTLDGLSDVTITSPVGGHIAIFDGSVWVNRALLASDIPTLTLSKISDSGTAAALNVPATGNAATGEVVKGSDTRLTDDRDPTAHASTHGNGGSDPITVAQSQVTDLTTDLAAKLDAAMPSGSIVDLPLSFADDSDTGLYRFGLDSMSFVAGGDEGLRVFATAWTAYVMIGGAWVLPATGGTTGQVLVIDGAGVSSWESVALGEIGGEFLSDAALTTGATAIWRRVHSAATLQSVEIALPGGAENITITLSYYVGSSAAVARTLAVVSADFAAVGTGGIQVASVDITDLAVAAGGWIKYAITAAPATATQAIVTPVGVRT